MNFGPFTGWGRGERVYLRAEKAMTCLNTFRRITTLIPVPLTLLSLERVQDDSAAGGATAEVWLVEAADGGLYCTTHTNLEKPEAVH